MINEWWAFVSLVGLGGWIVCVLFFIYQAFPSRDTCQAKAGLSWGIGFLLSFMVWIIGMLRA